jgi:hypothetical protein
LANILLARNKQLKIANGFCDKQKMTSTNPMSATKMSGGENAEPKTIWRNPCCTNKDPVEEDHFQCQTRKLFM